MTSICNTPLLFARLRFKSSITDRALCVRQFKRRKTISTESVWFQFHVLLFRHHDVTQSDVPVDDVVHIKIIIIFTERVEKSPGNPQPSVVKDKLQYGEYWDVEIHRVVIPNDVLFSVEGGFEKLVSKEAGKEVGVDRDCDHLGV